MSSTNKLKIEMVNIEKLIPYARNARSHSEIQISQIAGSIREFGFNNPVLIDHEDGIIAGHGRALAAQKLGTKEVPCVRLGHLTENQKRAYILADNKIALNSGWDEEMLKAEIESIQNEGMEIGITGFSEQEIDEMMEVEDVIAEAEENIVHEQSIQLEPAKEYILVMAENADQWQEMIAFFGLQKVRRGGYKEGSAFDAIGTERVLKFERVKNACSNTK